MQKRISTQSPIKRLLILTLFLGITLIIGIFERNIPFDVAVPGVKLGLANVVILTILYLFKPPEVFVIVVLKCVILVMFSGSMASFAYSLSGSVLSFFVMNALIKLFKDGLSPIGVSVAGAVFHNIGQVIAVYVIMGSNKIVLYLPVLLFSGVITGILVGIASKELLKRFSALKM